MLEALSSEMGEMMREGYPDGMKDKMTKKVVISADSDKGLDEGLSKAQEILKKKLSKDKDE